MCNVDMDGAVNVCIPFQVKLLAGVQDSFKTDKYNLYLIFIFVYAIGENKAKLSAKHGKTNSQDESAYGIWMQ